MEYDAKFLKHCMRLNHIEENFLIQCVEKFAYILDCINLK